MFGILNVNKPRGATSRDVVNRVQRMIRPHRAGHAGTLDPLATGVLVVCVGPATRLVPYVQQMPKQYRGTFLLGRWSDTEDVEGTVTELNHPPRPEAAAIEAALPRFLGEIMQQPPMYSALKIGGRRAYDLARRGETISLPLRPVAIHRIEVVRYTYPELVLDVICGSGTYIRSLGRDLARSLGTEAVLAALQRTAVGTFRIEDATPVGALTPQNINEHLAPPQTALAHRSAIDLRTEEAHRLRNGLEIIDRWGVTCPEAAALDDRGNLVAIVTPRATGLLKPVRVFLPLGQS